MTETGETYTLVVPYTPDEDPRDARAFALAAWYGNLDRMGATVVEQPVSEILPIGMGFEVDGTVFIPPVGIRVLRVEGKAVHP